MARTMVVLPTPGPPVTTSTDGARGLLDGAALLGGELHPRPRLERAHRDAHAVEQLRGGARELRPGARDSRTSAACISAAKTMGTPSTSLDHDAPAERERAPSAPRGVPSPSTSSPSRPSIWADARA